MSERFDSNQKRNAEPNFEEVLNGSNEDSDKEYEEIMGIYTNSTSEKKTQQRPAPKPVRPANRPVESRERPPQSVQKSAAQKPAETNVSVPQKTEVKKPEQKKAVQQSVKQTTSAQKKSATIEEQEAIARKKREAGEKAQKMATIFGIVNLVLFAIAWFTRLEMFSVIPFVLGYILSLVTISYAFKAQYKGVNAILGFILGFLGFVLYEAYAFFGAILFGILLLIVGGVVILISRSSAKKK